MYASLKGHFGVAWFKMVALDPVFYRANLTPQGNAGFRANSAIFLFFFFFFFLLWTPYREGVGKLGLMKIPALHV